MDLVAVVVDGTNTGDGEVGSLQLTAARRGDATWRLFFLASSRSG